MISWTNLLTRAIVPVAYFLLFLVPESQKMNILGIGSDKSQSRYLSRRFTEPEGETKGGGHRVAKPPLGAGPPGRGRAWSGPPGRTPTLPLRL